MTVYRALKVPAAGGDLAGLAEDLPGSRYCIQAPSITPDELAVRSPPLLLCAWVERCRWELEGLRRAGREEGQELRQRFQRNALLLFTVLKTSQTHTTPVLSQVPPLPSPSLRTAHLPGTAAGKAGWRG